MRDNESLTTTATIIRQIDSATITEAIEKLALSIHEKHRNSRQLAIVSIANGGIPFGEALASRIEKITGQTIIRGLVNAAFHRDDIGHKPIPKAFDRTELPFVIEDTPIILADDVLFSGRTVRAAINEIFDQGRPQAIELAVLCDRGCRKLPIQADYVGFTLYTAQDENVIVSMSSQNPEKDTITICKV